MDIRSLGARPTRRLTQAGAPRRRAPGQAKTEPPGADASPRRDPPSGLALSRPPRSARQGYADARRMQQE